MYEAQKKYREKNKELINKKARDYYKNNIEKCRLSIKKCKEKNKEKYRIQNNLSAKKYRENNKEQISQKAKEYYIKNRQKTIKSNSKYGKENYEKHKIYAREYYRKHYAKKPIT